MATNHTDLNKGRQLFIAMRGFVKQYPDHDLSSSFLSEAAMLGQLNYEQSKAIFELLGKSQQAKAGKNGLRWPLPTSIEQVPVRPMPLFHSPTPWAI